MTWRFIVDERGIETRLLIDADGKGDIMKSYSVGIMYALVFKRVKCYLDVKYGVRVQNYFEAQTRTRRVLNCWDGRPEVSDTYKPLDNVVECAEYEKQRRIRG